MFKKRVPFLILIAACNLLILPYSFSQKKLNTIIVDAGHGGKDGGAESEYENCLHSKEKDITLAISLKLVDELRKILPDVKTLPTRTTDIFQDVRDKAKIANDLGGQLFVCIHADTGPVKKATRQTGTREETRNRITYEGKGKHKQKIVTPYTVSIPTYETYKMPQTRKGTSVYVFAPHKTKDKLDAIKNGGEDFEIESDNKDSAYNNFDFNTPEGRILANIYVTNYQKKSDLLANLVNKEIAKTGRPALGVFQRSVGIRVLQSTNMPAILIETGFINTPEDERYLTSEAGQTEIAKSIALAVKKYKQEIEGNIKSSGPYTPTKSNPVSNNKPIDNNNVRPEFESRNTKLVKTLQVKSNKVKVALYDDGDIDGDIVSVYFNKSIITSKRTLTDKPFTFELNLDEGKNQLILFAENLGTIPPNTALMIITDGVNRYEVRLAADLSNNASITFEFKQ